MHTVKSVASTKRKRRFPHFLQKGYWDGGGIWRPGLFVSTVGINGAISQKSICDQGEQDTGHTQLEF